MNLRRKVPLIIFIFLFVFIFSNFYIFAQDLSKPPFYTLFTEAEKKLYDSLPEATKAKLIALYNLVKEKNIKASTQSFSQNNSTSTGNITSNPYLNQNTNQSTFPKPATQTQNAYNTPQTNPYYGTAMQKYFADSQSRYGNSPTGGYDQNYTPLTAEDMKNLPRLGNPNADCSNFGVSGNMNGTTGILKTDTTRLCIAFGRKIKVVSAKRSDGSTSRHNHGEAIDVDVNSFGDQKTRVLLTLAFICSGYNVGSYQRGFPAHFDHERASRWKTWSNYSDNKNGSSIPYEYYVQDALKIMGMPAASAGQFKATYSPRPSKAYMAGKAKAALAAMGIDGGLCRPETKI